MPDSPDPHDIPSATPLAATLAIPLGYVLCFDFGLRRIGTAVGQATTRTASPLETVSNGPAPDWAAIERLVKEWKPSQFLVGLPLNTEGLETEMSGQARRFGRQLEGRFGRSCDYFDERFSSQAAAEQFVELRAAGQARRKHAKQLDSVAAQLILQNWLQSLPEN